MDGPLNKLLCPLDAAPIAALLAPRSIAVIGAAPANQRSIRGMLLRVLRRAGFTGRIAPVNPSYREVDGLPCYPTIAAVEFAIDLAIIALPAELVCDIVEQCAAAGARCAIVISSGFAEESAAKGERQLRLSEIARRTGIRICGPNCEGFYNVGGRVAATFSAAAEPPLLGSTQNTAGRVAIVAQSGGLGFSLLSRGRAAGLEIGHVVTTGNECDLTAVDFIAHFAGDSGCAAIIAYLEEIRDFERFAVAAGQARAAGRPVIVIKIGQSEAGRRAAVAHTASDTGVAADFDAMFAATGVIAVADPDDAVAAALGCLTNPLAAGRRVGIITTAGGAGTVLSECFTEAGFSVPVLDQELQARLRPTFPSYGSAANPVDVTAQGIFTGGVLQSFEVLLGGEEVDSVVLALSLSNERSISLDVEALIALRARRSKPVLIYSYTLLSPFAREALSAAGFAVFERARDLVVAMCALSPIGHDHARAFDRGAMAS
ncbi:acyl-CoA synthetase (NDP forming) [Bradyrhizobium sp. GM24.11]